MARIRFSGRQINDMIMTLTGEVEPVGETSEDDKRFDNLLRLENVLDLLLEEMYSVCIHSNDKAYSMERAGKQAEEWMKKREEWLRSIIEEERNDNCD